MPSCLGLYVESNLIKYAKVTKDHDIVKVDSFGIKFFDKIGDAISQIIEETFSYKTPISINLSDEIYSYFQVFSLLNKNDIPKAIETEFESLCEEKEYNINALEKRYAIISNMADKEKLRVIHVAVNKAEITKKVQMLEGNKVTAILPTPVSIPNLLGEDVNENVMIVNIEDKTTITTIIDKNIYNIETLEEGSKEILDSINAKENSYSKSYNICKNTTIYTSTASELQEEASEYLDDIMPTLYNIVNSVKRRIEGSASTIEKVYITGTASIISNIDLYFSEYLENVKCEVLKPYFINPGLKNINIKDYIEVNSAISLALMELGVGITGMNFKKKNLMDSLPDWLKSDIGGAKKLKSSEKGKTKSTGKKAIKFNMGFDLTGKLDKIEINLLRTAGGILLLIIIYLILSGILTSQMLNKEKQIDEVLDDTNYQISLVTKDNEKINSKITTYQELTKNLNDANETLAQKYALKDAVPNLLNQIMAIIPKTVQVTSIENTTSKHIKITAQAEKYEQLAYFKAQLKNENALLNIVSDQGVKESDMVKIIIEGELP